MAKITRLLFLGLLFLFFATSVLARENKGNGGSKQDKDNYKPVDYQKHIVEFRAATSKHIWTNLFVLQHEEPAMNLEVYNRLLEKYKNGKMPENIKTYMPQISKITSSLNTLGKDYTYFLIGENDLPFETINYDNKKSIVIYGLGLSTIYNTLRFTDKERASKVITANVIPIIKVLNDSLYTTDFQKYILYLIYGSSDFTKENNKQDLLPEMLQIILDKNTCNKFTKNMITDQELIDMSVILLSSRDKKESDFIRIKVTLQ